VLEREKDVDQLRDALKHKYLIIKHLQTWFYLFLPILDKSLKNKGAYYNEESSLAKAQA